MGLTAFLRRNIRQLASGGYVRGDARIAFVHVPKCGGSSLTIALRTAMGPKVQLPFYPAGRHHDHIAAARASEVLGRDYGAFRADMLAYNLASAGARFVSGHCPVRKEVLDGFSDEWDFLLLLRDPVRRWLSNYFFNRYKPGDHFRTDMELDDFLETPRAEWYGRAYCHFLAPGLLPFGAEVTDAVMERSLEALDRFRIVSVLERLDLLAERFRETYGCRLLIPHVNRNPRGRSYGKREVTPEQMERIEELCRPDKLIYERALQLIGPPPGGEEDCQTTP